MAEFEIKKVEVDVPINKETGDFGDIKVNKGNVDEAVSFSTDIKKNANKVNNPGENPDAEQQNTRKDAMIHSDDTPIDAVEKGDGTDTPIDADKKGDGTHPLQGGKRRTRGRKSSRRKQKGSSRRNRRKSNKGKRRNKK